MATHISILLISLFVILHPLTGLPGAQAGSSSQGVDPAPPIPPAEHIQSVGKSSVLVNTDGAVMRQVVGALPDQRDFLPDACALPAPSLISPIGGTQISTLVPDFQWSRTGDLYRVQISAMSDFSVLIYDTRWNFGAANPSQRMNFNLSPNTNFYWRVASRCTDDSLGPYSSPASFSTGNVTGPFPNPPAMIAPPDGAVQSPLEVTFSWADVPGATAWQLRIYSSLTMAQNDNEWNTIPEGGTWASWWTNSAVWTFTSTGTYYWRVAAGTDAGWGSLSPVRSFTVTGGPIPRIYLPIVRR